MRRKSHWGAFSASAQVVIRERVEVERPVAPPVVALLVAEAQLSGSGWLDARWSQPLKAPGTLWDVWLLGSEAWSPTSLPLGGHLTAREPGAAEGTSAPVGQLFDLAAAEPVTSIPTSSSTWRSGGGTYVRYPGPHQGGIYVVVKRSQVAEMGGVFVGFVRDTVLVSSETVTPFGSRGPDWFSYGFDLGRAYAFGDQLNANRNEPTARCYRYGSSAPSVYCDGRYRSGFYWYDDGSYARVSLWAWAVAPSRLAVGTDVPPEGLGLGERGAITVDLVDVVAEASPSTPVTAWLDPTSDGTYGDLVHTGTGARGDTLALTLGEARAGVLAFEVQRQPDSLGVEVRVRVEPDYDAPEAPHPGYADVYVQPGDAIRVAVAPDSVSVGGEARVTVEAPGLDPGTPVTLSAATPHGRLVRVASGDTTAVVRPLTWSEIGGAEILFIADGERPDSTTSITIVGALEGGASDSATLTIDVPKPVVEILDSSSTVADALQVSLWENAHDLGNVANSAESVFVDDDPDRFVVRVTDPSGNTDASRVESVEVTVVSDAAGTEHDRTVALAWETGPDTGVFETPAQILMARDFPIPNAGSGSEVVTDDNYVLYTQVGADEFGATYGPVPDDALGDRSHVAVAGGTVSADYTGVTARVPVCRAGDLRSVHIKAFSMLEPYFDNGYYAGDGRLIGRDNGVWDDENGDGVVSSEGRNGERFEEYIEISRRAGTGGRPLLLSPGMNGVADQKRGPSVTTAHHADELHRAQLSWDQACLVVGSTAPTPVDLGVDFYRLAFGAMARRGPNTLDAILGGEDLGVIETINGQTQSGDFIAVYTTSLNVVGPNESVSVQGISYFPGAFFGAYDGLLAGRRYMLLDPTVAPGFRLLAHEIGHVATGIVDPLDPTDDYYFGVQYFFPSRLTTEDWNVENRRRIPRAVVEAVRSALPSN